MRTPKVRIRKVFMLLTVLSTGPLFAQQNGMTVTKSGKVTEDIYMAGATVQVLGEVEGDVVVAGGSVSIVNTVSGDVLAAGGTVSITANVNDDIRAAGGSVAIAGNVGDDAVAAGGSVTLASGSTVGGRAWFAGETVTVAGNVNRELRATGRKVILAGTIGGDVELYAESVVIEPGAVIKGKLAYSAPNEAVVREGAVIEGAVDWHESDFGEFDERGPGFAGTLVFFLSLAASAIVLFLIYSPLSSTAVQKLDNAPFKSLGLGLAVLFATPFVVLMLFGSVLGTPLGFIVLALYAVALIVGLLIGIIWIGDAGFRRLGKNPDKSKWIRAGSIVAAAALLLIVGLIPFIGGLAFLIVLMLGIGAVTLYFYQLLASRGNGLAFTSKPADQPVL